MAKKQVHENSLANLKRPPKGTTPNPNGRPKGSLNLKTILEKYLEVEVKHTTVEGERLNIPAFEAIVLAQITKARDGDTPAFRELMDRLEGKPKQHTDITTDGQPIETRVIISGELLKPSE